MESMSKTLQPGPVIESDGLYYILTIICCDAGQFILFQTLGGECIL